MAVHRTAALDSENGCDATRRGTARPYRRAVAEDAQRLFGPSHERLATLVALVAMHAALLESNIEALAASLGDVRQDEPAGIGFAMASSVIRKTLAESYASDEQAGFRREHEHDRRHLRVSLPERLQR